MDDGFVAYNLRAALAVVDTTQEEPEPSFEEKYGVVE
jgi:hypothetical protein